MVQWSSVYHWVSDCARLSASLNVRSMHRTCTNIFLNILLCVSNHSFKKMFSLLHTSPSGTSVHWIILYKILCYRKSKYILQKNACSHFIVKILVMTQMMRNTRCNSQLHQHHEFYTGWTDLCCTEQKHWNIKNIHCHKK